METEIQLLLTCIRCEQDRDISDFEGHYDDLYEQCLTCREGRQLYNKDFLESYCRVKEVVLIGEYDNVNRDTRIKGKCTYMTCTEEFSKTFRHLIKNGSLCIKCSKIISNYKIRKTNLQRYGVEHSLQSKEVRDKGKKTNLQRYGVEHVGQSKEVRAKMRSTNLERYGVECNLQLSEIKEKIKETNLHRYGFEYPSQSKEVQDKVKKTNLQRYGVENPLKSLEIKDKIKETNLQRYGVENPFSNIVIKDKIKETNLERYGVENPSQSLEIKDKKKDTNLKNRGVYHNMKSKDVRDKVKLSCLKRYGVEYCLQSEEVKEKSRITNLQRYGVEYPVQNPEILDKILKSAFSLKDYTLPSESVIKIQGYEHFALDELLQIYTEEDIVTGVTNVPRITYTDSEGKKHYHTPDIYIKSENRIIEVKSTWTFEKKEDNVLLKQTFAKQEGYHYEIWVYNAKGTKVEIYN